MGTNQLGNNIKAAIDALSAADKLDRTKLMQTLGNEIEDWVQTHAGPPGIIKMHGGSSAPSGYLLCDGSAVSRTTYAALFAVIGTTFGVGDGSTTFNLPDFRGIFPRGAGSNGTLTSVGGAIGTYQQDAMQRITGNTTAAFTHSTSTPAAGVFTKVSDGTEDVANGLDARNYSYDTFDSADSTSPNEAKTDDEETRPSNLTVNFIIKT